MIFAISLFRRRSVGKETGPSDILLAEMVCLWGPRLMPLSRLIVDNFSSGTNISETIVNVRHGKATNPRNSGERRNRTSDYNTCMMGCYGRSYPGKGKHVCGLCGASSLSSSHKELNISSNVTTDIEIVHSPCHFAGIVPLINRSDSAVDITSAILAEVILTNIEKNYSSVHR